MNRTRHPRLALSVLCVCALAVAACGGDDPEGGSGGGGDVNVVDSLDDVRLATVQITSDGEIRVPEGTQSVAGTGSGFVIDDEGFIVTNNHVVTGAGALKVRLDGDDREMPARIVGVSECNDLAVIQLTEDDVTDRLSWSEAEVEPPLELYAAGFPLGDPEFTMTRGIVSKAREGVDTQWASVREAFEHDANTQPGNSGGPMVDGEGRVIGVHYMSSDAGTGTTQFWAINADNAQRVVDTLKGGEDDGSIGVNGEAFLDPDVGVAGVWVAGVAPGGLASEAGVRPGDIITTMNGVALESGTLKEYCDVLRSSNLDDTISLRVLRLDTNEVLEGELNGRELETTFSFASELGDDLPDAPSGGGEAPSAEFTELTDDTNTLVVRVPSNWTDTTTAPQDLLGDGTLSPAILAAPNLAAFESDTGPGLGMFFLENAPGLSAEELLQGSLDGIDCAEVGRDDYSDGAFTGRFAELDCESVLGLLVVAVPDNDPSTVMIVAATAVSQADLRAIDEILASFNLI